MVDVPAADDGDRLESSMWVLGEPGHDVPVVHAPAVEIGEVGPDLATGERCVRPLILVPRWKCVDVVNGEDEWVEALPGKAELDQLDDGLG
jgi:hypothetical protein